MMIYIIPNIVPIKRFLGPWRDNIKAEKMPPKPSNKIQKIRKYSPGKISINLNKPMVIIITRKITITKYLKKGMFFAVLCFFAKLNHLLFLSITLKQEITK